MSHEEPLQAHQVQRPSRQQQFTQSSPTTAQQQLHERLIRRGAVPHHHVPVCPIESPSKSEATSNYRLPPNSRPLRYGAQPPLREPIIKPEVSRPRPRSFYEVPIAARELRGPRNPVEVRWYSKANYSVNLLRVHETK